MSLGDGFEAGNETLTVLGGLSYKLVSVSDYSFPIMPTGITDSANGFHGYIASFDEAVSGDQKQSYADALANGLNGSVTFPELAEDGIWFSMDLSNADAYIVRDGEPAVIGSFEDVAKAATNGETVIVNKNLNRAVSFGKTDEETAGGVDPGSIGYTVDLNGKTVGKLVNSSNANVTILSTAGSQPVIPGVEESATYVGVEQAGAGALTLSGVSINLGAGSYNTSAAVVSNGTLVLDDAEVSAVSTTNNAVAVIVNNGVLKSADSTIAASKSAEGGFAYGILANGNAASIELNGSKVSAGGLGNELTAVRLNDGSLSVGLSDSGGSVLSVSPQSASANAFDLYQGASASSGVAGCTFEVAAPAGIDVDAACTMTAWNVFVESAVDGENPSGEVLLAGSCDFVHFRGDDATHIRLGATPLSVDSSFSLGESAPAVSVSSDVLENDVFAIPAGEGSALDGKASLFRSSGDSENHYAGCTVEASAGMLSWKSDNVARIEGKGEFRTVIDAITAADDGETVVVLKDCRSLPITVSKNVTLDLSGYRVLVTAAIASGVFPDGNDYAWMVRVTAGRLTVADSGETKGMLELCAKTDADTLSFNGIAVDGGALTISGATVKAYYAGSQGQMREIAGSQLANERSMSGIYASGSEAANELPLVELSNGARLSVFASPASAGSSEGGAVTGGVAIVNGIFNGCDNADVQVVKIDESSMVEADNSLSRQTYGKIVSGDVTSANVGGDTSPLNSADIRKFTPNEDAALYQSIVEQFKIIAQYDGSVSTGMGSTSGVYNAGIYYAAPMELDDGTYVWAFSKQVVGEDIGKDDKIVPDLIYVQSTYQSSPDAQGIAAAASSNGNVVVNGTVKATSSYGNAYSLKALGDDGATWTVDGATLSASTSAVTPRRMVTGSSPNIGDELGISSSSIVGFYPKGSRVTEVVDCMPEAVAISSETYASGKYSASESSVVLAGAITSSISAEKSADIAADKVTLDESFSSDRELLYAGIGGVNERGHVFATTDEGTSAIGEQRAMFVDAYGAYLPIVSSGGNGLEWGTAYEVSFLDSYGNIILSERAADGQSIALPAAELAEKPATSTTEFVLMGWSPDYNANSGDEGVIPIGASFTFSAPSGADESITYYPVYEENARQVTYTFAGALSTDGTPLANAAIQVAAGQGLSAEGLGAVPNAEDAGNRLFVGWETSVRVNNKTVRRTIDPQSLGDFTSTSDVVLSAKYVNLADDQQLVVFKVDDYLYGYAVDAGSYPSFAAAMKAATGETDDNVLRAGPTKQETGTSWTFGGWHDGYTSVPPYDASVDFSAEAPLHQAVAGADRVVYTAMFSNAGPTKTTVVLHYYADWGDPGSISYRYNTAGIADKRDNYSVSYGTDISLLKPGVNASTVDLGLSRVTVLDYAEKAGSSWKSHKFLGWSTRVTDKLPLVNLPKAGETSISNYYAVYSDEVMNLQVSFVSGDATVKVTVPSDGTLSAALDALAQAENAGEIGAVVGEELVPTAPAGKKFVGWWSADNGGEGSYVTNPDVSALTDALSLDAPKAGDGRSEGSVTYYAVFQDEDKASMTLHAAGAGNWDPQDVTGAVVKGVAANLAGYVAPRKAGSAFVGWNTKQDGAGRSFDVAKDAVDFDSIELWAQYVELSVNDSAAQGAAADASNAYVSGDGALGADSVELSLEKSSRSDSVNTLGSKDKLIAPYLLKLEGTRNGTRINLTDELAGTVTLSLPVPAEYADKQLLAYVATGGGERKVLSVSVAEGADGAVGTVNLSMPDIIPSVAASTAGNIALVYRMSDEEYNLEVQREAYRSALNEAREDYSDADYDDKGLAALEQAYNEGLLAISAASTADEMKSAAQKSSDAMAAVPSKKGVDAAKASALLKLAEAYSGYSKGDYKDETWETLTGAFESAKKAVSDAKTVASANKAASDGLIAMAAIIPDVDSSSGSTGGSGTAGGGLSGGESGTGQSGSSDSSGSSLPGGTSPSSGLSGGNTTGGSASSTGSTGALRSTTTTSGLSSGLTSTAGGAASSGLSNTSGAASSGLGGTSANKAPSMLGGSFQDIDDKMASNLGIEPGSGVYIAAVDKDGPLDKAGVLPDDVIESVDGKDVKSIAELESALSGKKAGDTVELGINRGGEQKTVKVTLSEPSSPNDPSALSTTLSDSSSSNKFGAAGGEGASSDNGDASQGLPWFLWLFGALAVAGVAALVWWLMRRRNTGDAGATADEDDDFWNEDIDSNAQ